MTVEPQFRLRAAKEVPGGGASSSSSEKGPERVALPLGVEVVPVAVVPGVRLTDEVFEDRRVDFENKTLNGVVVVDPRRDDHEVRKWVHPSQGKGKENEVVVRNAVLDGVLHLLRRLRDSDADVRGVVAYGEGAYPVLAALRTMLREEAYIKRRCPLEGRAELDAIIDRWEYVVLVDPSGHPTRVLKTNIDDAVPELEVWCCGRSKQLVPLVLAQNATASEARELSRRCRGDVLRLELGISGTPAWKPPVTLKVPAALRILRGVDDPEEEAEYDQAWTKVRPVRRLEAKPVVAVAGLPASEHCPRCDKGPSYKKGHERWKRGCEFYVPPLGEGAVAGGSDRAPQGATPGRGAGPSAQGYDDPSVLLGAGG